MNLQYVDVPGWQIPGDRTFSGALQDPEFFRRPGRFCGLFGEHVEVIPRQEWLTVYETYKPSLRPLVHRIKDQGQEGSCSANAGTGTWETICNQQYGVPFILSAMSLYKRCGSGPNSGSTVGCNVRELRDRGALPAPQERERVAALGLDPDHCHPETGWRNRLPSGWEDTAKHFRLDEYYAIRTIEEFVSALLLGYAVHYGRRGHSIYAVSLVHRSGQWYAEYANSWAPSWGDQGFGYDTISGLTRSINSYGAYAVRDVVVPDALFELPSPKVPHAYDPSLLPAVGGVRS